MQKTKLSLPNEPVFNTEIMVHVCYINAGAHVGNDSFLSLIHESRVRWLAKFGWTEFDAAGVYLLVSESLLQYKAEALLGQCLYFELVPANFRRSQFDIFYRVTEKGQNKLILMARTSHVCIHPKEKTICSVPKTLFLKLQDNGE